MHGRCQLTRAISTALLMALAGACLTASSSLAQNREGFSQPVTFKVHNATTRAPGAVQRLTIDYLTSRPNNIVDMRPSGSAFTIPAVPLRESGQYIVTAWWQDVPYWFSFRGREMAPDTLTLNVFDTTGDLKDVNMTGMNLVAQRQGDTVKLEYLLEIDNANAPQRTVLGPDFTLAMAIPAGTSELTATYSRGPDPTPILTTAIGGDQLGLTVPLTWGKNTIRLQCRTPWNEGLTLPVGFNIPLQAWSFLVAPAWTQVSAMGLEPDPAAAFKGYGRFRGPVIAADRQIELRLSGKEADTGPAGKIFTAESDSNGGEVAQQLPQSSSTRTHLPVPLILVLALIVLILLFVANRRTRS